MTFRGPDAQNIWIEGDRGATALTSSPTPLDLTPGPSPARRGETGEVRQESLVPPFPCREGGLGGLGHVGFGHTLLQTTFESVFERQPCTLDGEVWITADARIDGRKDLIEQLPIKGGALEKITDVELILQAYQAWGTECVEHLIGDFAFAIWDGRKRRLFCARDRFGIKQFYYSKVGNTLLFSNTLNCLRQHPAVSDQLNDRAIGDFLLFDYNYYLDTTTFADIQRLPGGYTLIASDSEVRCQRYWTLPIKEPIRYRRASDYVENFKEIFSVAVGDRLRQDQVAIWMSGGLDSTSIAATALELKAQKSLPLDLQAFCTVYDRLIPDRERYYSGIAAEALSIPIHYTVGDGYQLFDRWHEPELHRPEPTNDPLLAIAINKSHQVATHSRVVLYGQGGDEVLYSSRIADIYQTMPLSHLIADIGYCLFTHGIRPPIGIGAGQFWQQWFARTPQPPNLPLFPTWLNKSFAQRLNLSERWQQIMEDESPVAHPSHPRAYERLIAPIWASIFESSDPGVTGMPQEVRLPFLDLRLIDYVLAIPPLPWCIKKEMLRVAMEGKLPEIISRRPKTPLAGDPVYLLLSQSSSKWQELAASSELLDYVAIDSTWRDAIACKRQSWAAWSAVRVHSLNYWLKFGRYIADPTT
jgi:asparagine synthase (glutamine-hydrolysing)